MALPLPQKSNRVPLSDMRRPVKQEIPRFTRPVFPGGISLGVPPISQTFENQPPKREVSREIPVQLNVLRYRMLWMALLLLFVGFSGWLLFQKGKALQASVLRQGEGGYSALLEAAGHMKQKDYEKAVISFEQASSLFAAASEETAFFTETMIQGMAMVPGLSRAASGKHVIEAGKHFSEAGKPLAILAEGLMSSKDAYAQGEKISLIQLLYQSKEPLREARISLERAEESLRAVAIDDIPEEKRDQFLAVRKNLPLVLSLLVGFEKNEFLLEELLGGNGPRTYLFLLQNNHELRATGGFIGSYALVDVSQGVIRRFFVDGIFNPDGQLKENIVPPKPIQKISAGWSLHDSNWFPDFPTSAEKAIFFYEKTGGPTVDGVVTLTPTVMQKLLKVIGPIALPQYGLTVDADNFIPVIQEQVEVKYDKELNEPKKILVDLSRMLLEKVFSLQDRETTYRLGEALIAGLNEKHVLMYMRHADTQKLVDEIGWSGRVLETGKDYLSVIHSNINGYKTDGVIDETINHQVAIEEDGSIIDIVTITRSHRGGDTPYEWWNKVNADYLRVYVPKGSELLSSRGTTWEFPEPPLDYERLGFREDADVVREEEGIVVDKKSGVRISLDAGKTVFGAWVYVSPKESVTVEYRYKLPFRLEKKASEENETSYSILYQKQSGSQGSALTTRIVPPLGARVIWQTEPNLVPYERELGRETTLKTDIFYGVVFERE